MPGEPRLRPAHPARAAPLNSAAMIIVLQSDPPLAQPSPNPCAALANLQACAKSSCAPGPSLTGDRRHGRGCELRRCSGRLTSGPGAPIGASRHRPNGKISTARLLQSRASLRAACARAPATCGAPWCAKSAPLGATRVQGLRRRSPGRVWLGWGGVLSKRSHCHRFLCCSLCSAALDANICPLSISRATDLSSCFTRARARRRRRRRRRRHCRRRCCRTSPPLPPLLATSSLPPARSGTPRCSWVRFPAGPTRSCSRGLLLLVFVVAACLRRRCSRRHST